MVDATVIEKIIGVPHTPNGPYLVVCDHDGVPYLARWDTASLGEQPSQTQIEATTLAMAREASVSRINARADDLCSNMITPGATQPRRYALKLAQAEAYLKDGTPTEAEYPLIYSEVGITASSASDVAVAVCAAAERYDAYCAAVEGVRVKGKGAIKAATSVDGVAMAEAAVVWPEI